jgi:hypothetical protein
MNSEHDPSGLSDTSLVLEEKEAGDSINWNSLELKLAC